MTTRKPIIDGGRQRCTDCGHPRSTHNPVRNCSVPKCPCPGYQMPEAPVVKG